MGRSIQTPTPVVRGVRIVVPVNKGGTGVSHESHLPTALGIVPTAVVGVANGVAQADENGLIKSNQLPLSAVIGATINGPDEIFPGQVVTFVITNFDVITTYDISFSAGTFSRAGKDILYTAPASAQSVVMTINGRECSFQVLPAAPAKPSIAAPIYDGVINSTSYTFTSSLYSGSALTHESSDWQIASDILFNSITHQVSNSLTDKTTWTLSGLISNALRFIRVRHKAADGTYSAWSDPSRFSIDNTIVAEYLLIGGGGGGGSNWGNGAGSGGGGAGGYRSSIAGELSGNNTVAELPLTLLKGTSYAVVIGAGGNAGTPDANARGQNGGNTSFAGIVSLGGGGGLTSLNSTAPLGGSGGGAAAGEYIGDSGSAAQGTKGGDGLNDSNYRAGGGGGAGAPGQSGAAGSNGGNGLSSSVTGTEIHRAGGGGGGRFNGGTGSGGLGGGGASHGGSGVANSGGGGGGARLAGAAGNGGSGVAFIRYLGTPKATGGVITSVGGYTVHTFTTNGNLVVS